MKQRILIVEDDPWLAELSRDYLEQSGYETSMIQDGRQVLPLVREAMPSLILLDLMLPGRDGLDICQEIRGFSTVPIIMVTARIEEIDRILGLELGADDYICKPFSPRELVARVKAVLRRGEVQQNQSECILELDEACFKATLCGQPLELTAVQFRLLSLLVSSPGRVFSRSQLMDSMYVDQRTVCDRTIDSHIKKVRKKIARIAPECDLIHSLYGVGYKYEKVTTHRHPSSGDHGSPHSLL